MSNKSASFFLVLSGYFVFALLNPAHLFGQTAGKNQPIGILISQEIRPFIEMVEGLEANLKTPFYRIFMDSEGRPYSTDPRYKGLSVRGFRAMVAVGPQALYYLVNHNWSGILVYGMVLNPIAILGANHQACGVSLNLPYWGQMFSIRRTFPDIKRLGVFFDPANNQEWFNHARGVAGLQGITLVPLLVKQQSDISKILKKRDLGLNGVMFIPDRTVISRTIIEFVIKEALLQGIPTIGYNQFFHDSGAAMSFIIDYRTVGKRVAQQVRNILEGRPCSRLVPDSKILVNVRVAQKLGIRLGNQPPLELETD